MIWGCMTNFLVRQQFCLSISILCYKQRVKRNKNNLQESDQNLIKDVFFLSGFSFTKIHDSQDSMEAGGYFFNSSLPLLPAPQSLRYQPSDYCRELTSFGYSWQSHSNREPLGSKHKSLNTELGPRDKISCIINIRYYQNLNMTQFK